MQTKKASFIEAVFNTAFGYTLTFIFSPLFYWIVGVKLSFTQIGAVTLLFTLLSVARNYIVRRWFNKVNKIV